jgi:hypothetical protein
LDRFSNNRGNPCVFYMISEKAAGKFSFARLDANRFKSIFLVSFLFNVKLACGSNCTPSMGCSFLDTIFFVCCMNHVKLSYLYISKK